LVPARILRAVYIAFSVIHFDLLTGASMHVYELARVLRRRGHRVLVAAPTIGGDLTRRARQQGIEVAHLGQVDPEPPPDILHLNQAEQLRGLVEDFPSVPAVATIHSAGRLDQPLRSSQVRAYACVRPELRDLLVHAYGISRERTDLIYNGIDLARFSPDASPAAQDRPVVLFVGTVAPLRREAALDLIERGRREGFDVRFIGLRNDDYLDDPRSHVSYFEGEVWHVEEEVRRATATAGVFLGRTTIEGWACGKPGWIYDVDLTGHVRSVGLFPPPPRSLMSVFDIEHVADRYELLYEAARDGPQPRRQGS
jgi:hypothetical protein